MYSQYNSNPYQPLRADTEGNGSQASNKRKQIQKVINYSRPFLEGWSQEPLMLINFNLENMAQCNTRFTALYYLLECYWSFCRPIINSKPPLKSMDLCHWYIILGGRIKTPSEVRNHPQGTPKFTQLDYIDQRVNSSPLGICHTAQLKIIGVT